MFPQKGGYQLTKYGYLLLTSADVGLSTEDPLNDKKFSEKVTNYIFKNSTYTLFSYSSLYGLIFKLTLKDGVKSILTQYDPDVGKCVDAEKLRDTSSECYKEMREFIVKMSFLTNQEIDYDFMSKKGSINKRTNKFTDFVTECETQYDIYSSNFLAGKYIVPSIITKEPKTFT